MKRTLFLLWLIVSCYTGFAQKIHFTDSTNIWHEQISFFNDFDPYIEYYTFHYVSDTVFAGHTYRKVNHSVEYYFAGNFSYVREDTVARKVYFWDYEHDSDIVLYDYNLAVGDTFKVRYTCDNRYVVLGMDTVQINGTWHTVWEFSNRIGGLCGTNFRSYIIEGVGCINDPFYQLWEGGVEPPQPSVYCFLSNGITPPLSKTIHVLNNLSSCRANTEILRGNHTCLAAYPVPAVNFINITGVQETTQLTITNTLGQVMCTQLIGSSGIKLDITSFAPGVYSIRTGKEAIAFTKL